MTIKECLKESSDKELIDEALKLHDELEEDDGFFLKSHKLYTIIKLELEYRGYETKEITKLVILKGGEKNK